MWSQLEHQSDITKSVKVKSFYPKVISLKLPKVICADTFGNILILKMLKINNLSFSGKKINHLPDNFARIGEKCQFSLIKIQLPSLATAQLKIKICLASRAVDSKRSFLINCLTCLKLTWKVIILLQTVAIFFLSNLYLKQGIDSVYVMVDFICKGYLENSGSPVERELQNEKFLPNVGFEPGAFCLRSEGATTELRGLMSIDEIKVHLGLTVLFLEICLYHVVDEAN